MPTGQIRKALSGFYYVYDNGEMITCRGRGVFRNRGESPLVGDIVDYKVEGDNDGTITVIHEPVLMFMLPCYLHIVVERLFIRANIGAYAFLYILSS